MKRVEKNIQYFEKSDWVVFARQNILLDDKTLTDITDRANKQRSKSRLFISSRARASHLRQKALDWLRLPSKDSFITRADFHEKLYLKNPNFVVAHKSLIKDSSELRDRTSLSYVFASLLSRSGSFSLITSALSDESFTENTNIYQKEWYLNFHDEWEKLLQDVDKLTPQVRETVQRFYLVDLHQRIKIKNKQVLAPEEIKKFWDKAARNLINIDTAAVLHFKQLFGIHVTRRLLELKVAEFKTVPIRNGFLVLANDLPFLTSKDALIEVDLIDYDTKSRLLHLDIATFFPLDVSGHTMNAVYNDETVPLEVSERYGNFSIFGETLYRKFCFHLSVSPRHMGNLAFYLKGDHISSTSPAVSLVFNRSYSRMSRYISSWSFGSYIASRSKSRIRIKNYSVIRHIFSELRILFALLVRPGRLKTSALFLRITYWITRPYYKKRSIWMFADKIYSAGDNGEFLYRYSLQQNDGIEKYYALRKDSKDAPIFEKEGLAYLPFGSLRHKLLFLNASIVFGTHTDVSKHHTFSFSNMLFRDLFRYDTLFIQHGLSVQHTPNFLNRIVDNSALYFIASNFEKENLLLPEYDMKPETLIESGLPRFDMRKNDDKKQILIAPTWRDYIAPPPVHSKSRGYSNLFTKTPYFKLYHSFINNKKFIETAKRTGYSITFLLHPVTASQKEDFSDNEYVSVLSPNKDTNYAKMLSESSLMVTDYSGVQFDFAYMYKPIVYFHPPELPPSYEESVYKYEKHALGDITTEIDDLVETICEYMENDCKIKPKYKKRIDSFFYHHDFDNCKRIYDRALAWQRESRQTQ